MDFSSPTGLQNGQSKASDNYMITINQVKIISLSYNNSPQRYIRQKTFIVLRKFDGSEFDLVFIPRL
jgi:hypothetical protein